VRVEPGREPIVIEQARVDVCCGRVRGPEDLRARWLGVVYGVSLADGVLAGPFFSWLFRQKKTMPPIAAPSVASLPSARPNPIPHLLKSIPLPRRAVEPGYYEQPPNGI
jgi:hypothetical protein